MTRPPSRSNIWATLLAVSLLFACTEGPLLLGPDQTVPVNVSFVIDPTWAHLFDAAEVDRLRLTARSPGTGEVVGSLDEDWNAATWTGTTSDTHAVMVTTGPSGVIDILLEIELLGGADVQWSTSASIKSDIGDIHHPTSRIFG